ncbi:MAG: 30S ribosome-binding factor RbfA, partial [Gemmatimonadetes bacterium]
MGHRRDRLNAQFKREISEILRREVRDPRIGTVIVTDVDVTPDLWLARVFVQIPGDEAVRAEALAGLQAAAPFVRRHLKPLRIRRIPELRFLEDRTLEQAHRIEEILREVGVEDGGGGDEGAPPGEVR